MHTFMANILKREKAKNLRRDGKSFDTITRLLGVPKSTIRYWCRDIVLSRAKLKILFQSQKIGGIWGAEKLRKQRLQLTHQLLEEGVQEISILSRRERLLIGVALYWAEGYRKGDGEFGFTNSDPTMIKFMILWLQEACHIEKRDIKLRVCINASHQRRLKAIHQFWATKTSISPEQFSKPTLISGMNKKIYPNSAFYFGTLRIKVRRSTNLRRKIMGWIRGIAQHKLA